MARIIRFLDVLFSLLGLVICSPLFLIVILINWCDSGAPIFYQKRVGRDEQPFVLIKFRTMHLGTESTASHLVSSSSVTKVGYLMRRTKIDELPQLWNVLRGEMSIVGPRPSLFEQTKVIEERRLRGVLSTRPGITGLAQIKKIDMSTPKLLAKTDKLMVETLSISNYFKYIFMSVIGKGSGDRVKREANDS